MSLALWEELPEGFLRMRYRAWSRLDHDVRRLIFDLATKQSFTCAFCDCRRGLEVEHDHYPEEGPGEKPTVYNIRGLACRRCNWHLGMYETDERGGRSSWENVYCIISARDYESYIYRYECRVSPLLEALAEQRIPNYWRRTNVLYKFDDWRYEGGKYPGYWGFDEIKEKKYGPIRTPRQFLKALIACTKFFLEEKARNPDFQPPEEFWKVWAKVGPLIEEVRSARDSHQE